MPLAYIAFINALMGGWSRSQEFSPLGFLLLEVIDGSLDQNFQNGFGIKFQDGCCGTKSSLCKFLAIECSLLFCPVSFKQFFLGGQG